MSSQTVRIAAVSDIHYSRTSHGALQELFSQITSEADVLVLPGDLTDYGLAEEARVLAKDLTAFVKIPIVAVLGNHDYEAGETGELRKILTDAGVHMLDGDAVEVHGIGFAGVKGFAGGFGRGALGPWGEVAIKQFVQEAIHEALKLESALARLTMPQRVAVLHYAPIRATVEGEAVEIIPWLGSSRLEEPLTRFDVSAVFHGHAHKGAPEGHTSTGIPVFNVAHSVLKANYPDRPAFRLLELPREAATAATGENGQPRPFGRRAGDLATPAAHAPNSAEHPVTD
jgi:Icc-related predicted phosphoesterase